jgi:hypothetical protein
LPDAIAPGWEHGTDVAYVRDLQSYWLELYDWPRTEACLNERPQFVTDIDGLDVHFYWERTSRKGAPTIIFTHGWPGSVVEFVRAIDQDCPSRALGREA